MKSKQIGEQNKMECLKMESEIKDESIKKMRNKLFEIILEIDRLSVKKDYDGLRMLHYNNCNWLQSVGLGEDYYDYLFENEIRGK